MVAAAKSEHTVQTCIAEIERRIARQEARIIADLIKGRDPIDDRNEDGAAPDENAERTVSFEEI